MGNCLNNQLKAKVNNSNLPFLDKIVFTAKSVAQKENPLILVKALTTPITLTTEVAHLHDSNPSGVAVKSITVPANGTRYIFLDKADYTILMDNKYADVNLLSFGQSLSVNINDFAYKKISEINGENSGSIGDISAFVAQNSLLTTLQLQNNNGITGDSSVFINHPNASNITEVRLHYTSVTGNIENFSDLVALETLLVYGSNISGAIENLVNIWVNTKQRATPSTPLNVYGILKACSFGTQSPISSTQYHWLTWDNTDGLKIILYTGASSYTDCPTVYCMGYTDQAAAEAAFPGKTVIRVDA